jgi:hypothetical protein
MTVASQVLGATVMLMSETLLFTVTKEGMDPLKNIWRGWRRQSILEGIVK